MIQSTPVTGGRGYRHESPRPPEGRRGRIARHLLPLLLAGAVAFVAGIVIGGFHTSPEQDVAREYVTAYAEGDHRAMYALLTEEAKRRTSEQQFTAAHRDAAAIATTTGVGISALDEPDDGVVRAHMAIQTRVFGAVRETLELPLERQGDEPRVAWEPHLAFPGVRRGEGLERTTELPERATLLTADGEELDEATQASIGGQLGPIPDEREEELRAAGVPEDAQVGVTGLERALDEELRGRPGGRLRAGDRVLAGGRPAPAEPVRTTIVPRVQQAASTALAGRLGGVVAMHVGGSDHGDVIAAAGIGLSGLQPPGSTFKIITLAGALEAGITRPSKRYDVATSATLEGVELQNANGESCGGTLIETFAHSCNSVFGPMGAELGARRLVEAAERFGFNRPPAIAGAATSVIPPAAEIGDDLAVGATAIGQGRMQASTLQMALAAAAIADRGRLPRPTLRAADRPASTQATSAEAARVVGRGMRAVVRYGTGTAAAIDGVAVAGKTGTAELRQTQGPGVEELVPAEDAGADTSAWFAAYGPARRPRVAVAVLIVEGGAGGAVAAPAAATVLAEALRRRG